MVSVVIPLYNKAHIVANSIQSVLDQTYHDFELIIVNDGSTDDSLKEVGKFIDKRIRLINQENKGVSAARNRGIKEAKYDLIAFLDGDDWWDKDFLKTMINLYHKFPEAGLYGGQYVQVNRHNKTLKLDRFPLIDEGYFELHKYLYAVCSSSVVIRKDVFEVSGDFDENLTHGEDTDMWIRIGFKYRACYTNKIISFYNIGGSPLTKSTGKTPKLNNHLLSKIDSYFGKGGSDFDLILKVRKISYLKMFYIQNPSNPKIREMIISLPSRELHKRENRIFRNPIWLVYLKHGLLIARQSLLSLLYLLKVLN